LFSKIAASIPFLEEKDENEVLVVLNGIRLKDLVNISEQKYGQQFLGVYAELDLVNCLQKSQNHRW
jgi:hypothetical protein